MTRHSDDQDATFDIRRLEEDFADNPEVLEEILAIFAGEAPERLEVLKRGIESGDAEAVRTAAHSLANTTGTLMANKATSLARSVEEAARAGDAEILRARGTRLVAEVSAILDQIATRKSGSPGGPN
ncbi:MAG: Hpt domain-containing protein [Spirochaetaceae bacterium]